MSAAAAVFPDFAARFRARAGRLLETPAARQRALIAGLVAFGLVWGAGVALGGIGTALLALSMVAAIACLIDFRAGVMILIIIMPISSSSVFPHAMFGMTGMNPLNLLLVMTLVTYLMNTAGDKSAGRFIPRPLWWLYIVPFVAAGLIGMWHVGEIPTIFKASEMVYFDNAIGYLRDMMFKPLGLVVYALLIAAAVGRSKQPERFVTPMFLSIFVMAALAVVFVATSGASLSELAGTYSRAFFSSLGMHANDLGRLYAVAYALLLFVWDRTDRIVLKTVLVFAMVTVALALMLTFSRGAFLGFVIVNAIYLVSRRTIKTFILAALLVPLALIFAPGAIWSRLELGIGEGLGEITAGRFDEIWTPLMPEVLTTPPWGNGLGAIMWSKPMRFEEMMFVGHPHNAYLLAWLDTGLIGTLLLLAFWTYAWVSFRKLAKDVRIASELQGFFEGAAAGLVSFLIAGFAGSSLMPVPEQSFLWLALGVMWGVKHHLVRAAAAKPDPAKKPQPRTATQPWEPGVGWGGR